MSWRVLFRPEVEADVNEAAEWYNLQQPRLGNEFREELIRAFEAIAENPLLQCRRHPHKNIRWRYPDRFPYRIIYEVIEAEQTVIIAAVLHAARHERHWQRRV
jgi:plasmid stabilization system protein ParE